MTFRTGLVNALAVVAVFAASASAQVDSAQIRGRVTDTAGAPLPGVRLSVTGRGIGAPRETFTDDNGRFAFTGLQPSPATYTVTGQLPGFETMTVVVRATEIDVDSTFTIRMHIGCYGPGDTRGSGGLAWKWREIAR